MRILVCFRADLLSSHELSHYLSLDMPHQFLAVSPASYDARQQLQFFFNSLSLLQGKTRSSLPSIVQQRSLSVLVPVYNETVWYSVEELRAKPSSNSVTQDAGGAWAMEVCCITTIEFLVEKYKCEWNHFVDRVSYPYTSLSSHNDGLTAQSRALLDDFLADRLARLHAHAAKDAESTYVDMIIEWASYRGQTLARTVRGLVYAYDAMCIQAAYELQCEEDSTDVRALLTDKLQIIIAAQIYGDRQQIAHRKQMQQLMRRYPHIDVVYNYDFLQDVRCKIAAEKKCCRSDARMNRVCACELMSRCLSLTLRPVGCVLHQCHAGDM